MCGGGGGGIGNFIAPILGLVASVAMPFLAPALLPLEAGLIGAGIGAGTNLLGDAITGRPVDPLGLAASTVLGGAGGYLGAGGFSDISNALGLGGGAAASTGAGLAGMESAAFSGINAADAAASVAGPIAGSAGQTAAGAAAGLDPIGIGATTQTSISPTDLAASAAGAAQAPTTSSILSTLGKGYDAIKGPLAATGIANLAKGVLGGGGGQQFMAAAPSMAAPSMGGGYTTGQGGRYGGGLGTVWRPDLGAYATSYAPGQQPKGGGFSDTANVMLGPDSTMMG
jgi:hypothetical protein